MCYEDENIWLSQKLIATLYDVEIPTINYHIKKIFKDSELQPDAVIRKFLIAVNDGKKYNANHYSLEMIIAVAVFILATVQTVMTQCELWTDNNDMRDNAVDFHKSETYSVANQSVLKVAEDPAPYGKQ